MSEKKACCTPSQRQNAPADGRVSQPQAALAPHTIAVEPAIDFANTGATKGMKLIEGGIFLMGTDYEEAWATDGEGPVREVTVKSFWIDSTHVTNAQFAAFVEATNYKTEADRFGWSFVFHNQLSKSKRRQLEVQQVQGLEWWHRIDGASWRHPEGPGTSIKKRMDHPVVHVSWNDAINYSRWAGKRLPTEAEWEIAARGSLVQKIYAWGDELTPKGKHMCNIWQGEFPHKDTAADGFAGPCPVKAFPPNGFGLYGVSGNVWEWVNDWWSPSYHLSASRDNPKGPPFGDRKTMKGGSFLCHDSYCNRYRVAARTSNTPDSSTINLGFRCARDV